MKRISTVLFRVSMAVFVAAAAEGCGIGQALMGEDLPAPTINNAPSATNQAALSVTGNRPSDTAVWAIYDNGTQTQLAASDSTTTWSAKLPLTQGKNDFVLVAKRGTTGASGSTPYSIILDQVAPNTPSVSYPPAVLVPQNGTATVTISGTKSPDSTVVVVVNGVSATVTNDTPGSSTWSTTITVNHGSNTVTVSAEDTVGNTSGITTFNIYGSDITPPTINPYKTPTNQAVTTLTGTKGVNTNLYVVINGGTPISVGSLSASTWTYTFTLPQQGINNIAFYATDPTQPNEYHSQEAVATIVLKSTPPAPPQIISPNPFPGATETSNPTLTVTVLLPSDGYLCVSHAPPTSSNVVCFVTSNPNQLGGTTPPIQIPLYDLASPSSDGTAGSNTIYLSSEDLAGNFSSSIFGTIYRDSPPVVKVTPAPGSVYVSTMPNSTNQTIPVSVTASPFPGDAGQAGTAITNILVSLDGGAAISQNSANFSAGMTLVSPANGSEHTITVTVTTQDGGTTTTTSRFVYSNGSAFMISNDTDGSNQPPGATNVASVFDHAGNLHVVWQDNCAQGGLGVCQVSVGNSLQPPDIFYRWRDITGKWSNIQVVSSTGQDDGISNTPSIAVDQAGTVHVVWSDNGSTGGKPSGGQAYAIEHRAILASNGNFIVNQNPNTIDILGNPNGTTPAADTLPSVAADASGNVYAVWQRQVSATRNNIMFTQYTSSTSKWASAIPVTVNPNTGLAGAPDVAASSTGAVVVWQDCNTTIINPSTPTQNLCNSNWPNPSGGAANFDIFMSTVTGGTNVSTPTLVTNKLKTNGQDGDSRTPTVIVDPTQTAWVFWSDNSTLQLGSQNYSTKRNNIWLSKFGANPSSYTLVSNDPNQGSQNASKPAAAIGADGAVAAVWLQSASYSSQTIHGSYTSSYQLDFNLPIGIFTAPMQESTPVVSLDGTSSPTVPSNMHVLWPQYTAGSTINPLYNIVYQYVPDPGP